MSHASDAENVILTPKCASHMGSRWCAYDLGTPTIETEAFDPPLHQGLYFGKEERNVKCSYPGGTLPGAFM